MRIDRAPASFSGVTTLMAIGDIPEEAKLDPLAVAVFSASIAALGAYLLSANTNTTLFAGMIGAAIGYKYVK